MEFSAAADELYGVNPDDFVATRTRLAAELRKDDARRLTALRRPTVSAWAVNLLVRDDAVGPLLDLGERMREAWTSGDDIGPLEQERARLISALVRRARTLAAEVGRPLSETFAREVEDTLSATVADPGAARAIRDGRLDHPLRHAGFGPLGAAPARRTAPAPRRKAAEKPKEDPRIRRRRLEETARQAEERAEEARRVLADWENDLAAAEQRLAETDDDLREARERLAALERRRRDLDRRAQVARRERHRAGRSADEARRRAEEARSFVQK